VKEPWKNKKLSQPWKKPGWKPVIRDGNGEWLETQTCPECKSEIPRDARRCRHCGARLGWSGVLWSLQPLGCLLLILGIGGFLFFLFLVLVLFAG